MMLSMLMLLAAQDPETAIEAERAFNRSAQIEGQWTAFRKFSTPDALIFTPQPAKAHEVLPQKDPRLTIQWWPAESYVSCDGTLAVNTGPWVSARGIGYFTTVWVRQSDERFKWVYDGGDALTTPRALPENPRTRTAACSGKPGHPTVFIYGDNKHSEGESPDRTLLWRWQVGASGERSFQALLWTGKRYETVIDDRIAAPK